MKRLKRHVLKRSVCDGLEGGHPWVFRDKVGDDSGLKDGDWLQLMDSGGTMIGTGVYQAEGGVAIRVFRLGLGRLNGDWLKRQLDAAISRRAELPAETDGYRVLNGESDGVPGIVLDVYAGVGVLQTYAPGVDAIGRFLAGLAYQRLGLSALIWKAPSKRVGSKQQANRLLRGERPYVVKFQEGTMELSADLFSGQKSGTYLDLRGLRRHLREQDLRGKKVLNLFAYTGMAGLACALAGAKEVVNVDQAQPSLDFGRRYHKHQAMSWVAADIFDWVNELPKGGYDLIIVDPPSMASNKTQVTKALKAYHRLYTTLLNKLKPGGTVIACCCTSRITPREFEDKVSYALRPLHRAEALPMEIDHKPAFAEADYLKVLVFRQDAAAMAREAAAVINKARAQTEESEGRAGRPSGKGRAGFRSAAPSSDRSAGAQRGGGGKPGGGKASGSRPGGGKPGGAKPAGSRPGGHKPGGSRPGGAGSAGPRSSGSGTGSKGGGFKPDGPQGGRSSSSSKPRSSSPNRGRGDDVRGPGPNKGRSGPRR